MRKSFAAWIQWTPGDGERGSGKCHVVRSGLGGMILFLVSKTSKRSFHQPTFLIPMHCCCNAAPQGQEGMAALGGAERNQESVQAV